MKKIISILLITFLFIPCVVNAAQCDPSKVYIDSISIDNAKGNAIELEDATAKDKKVNLNLRMATKDDEILYKVVLKNDSNEDYEINKNSINLNSDYLEYSLESDNNNIVKANSSRTIYLRVKYAKTVDQSKFVNGVYQDNITMKVNLRTDDTPANPKTGISYIIIISLILIISGLSLIIYKKKKLSSLMILVGLILLPVGVNALCTCEIIVDSKVTIKITDETHISEFNRCTGRINESDEEFTIGITASDFFDDIINSSDYRISFIRNGYFECVDSIEEPKEEDYPNPADMDAAWDAYDEEVGLCYNNYGSIVRPNDKMKSKDEGLYAVEYIGICSGDGPLG